MHIVQLLAYSYKPVLVWFFSQGLEGVGMQGWFCGLWGVGLCSCERIFN